jgi:L-malate glycosyltransferase
MGKRNSINFLMSEKKKILIIENSVAVTGSLKAVLRTSLALRIDYDFVFILPVGSQGSSLITENNFKLYELPLYELKKSIASILFYFPRLIRSVYQIRKIANEENISIVHVNDFYNLILPLWKMGGGSIKYLCYVNFVPDRFPFFIRRLWINSHQLFASKIVAVSNHVLKQLPINKKVVCVPDALPEEPIDNSDVVVKKKTVLYLGNFINGKGQDFAIKAFAKIAANYTGWKLKFVGGDMGLEKNQIYKQSLRAMAKELGIENQVEMLGFAAAVAKEYKEAAIALNFSLSESFSLTVQEAMFYGCPIIATRCGGPEELIEHKFSGLLVPLNDIEQMSSSIQHLIENPSERERLKTNAAKQIRDKYSKHRTIDLLNEVYQGMLRLS